jgi:integrase
MTTALLAPTNTAPREKMRRQQRGGGSITMLKDGRFRARAFDKRRTNLGFFATRDEAEEVIEGCRRTLAVVGPPTHEITLAQFANQVLDERELAGMRSVGPERRCFRKRIAGTRLANLPVAVTTARDVRDFAKQLSCSPSLDKRAPRTLAHASIKRIMAIVSCVFAAAVEKGIRDDNPASAVKVHRPANLAATKDTFAWLTHDEQIAFERCPTIPRSDKMIVLFAIGTGLRRGELWNLELCDLHVADDAQGGPHVVVRFGSKGKPPKNGKIRRVPLFGVGLQAAREWLEILPNYIRGKQATARNECNLVFPGPMGTRRPGGFGHSSYLRELLAEAGITRHVRFHDLRHTCASSLVSGAWGRRWSLLETSKMLGHSSIKITERYAHLGEDFLTRAAAETQRIQETPSAGAIAGTPVALTVEQMRALVAEADAAEKGAEADALAAKAG